MTRPRRHRADALVSEAANNLRAALLARRDAAAALDECHAALGRARAAFDAADAAVERCGRELDEALMGARR